MKNQFKVGDLVYIFGSNKIGKIIELLNVDTVRVHNQKEYFHSARLCHATQENYERLSATFPNVEFEPPPKRREPKEIIGLMKEAGHKFILCKAKDHNSDQWETVVAFGISSYCSPTSSSDYMHDSFGSSYFEFYPINSKGQKIIDFVDGEVVLESENE